MLMNIKGLLSLGLFLFFVISCSNPLEGNNSPSLGPATPEPEYLGNKPISYGTSPFKVKISSKFKYRPTLITGGSVGLQAPDGASIVEIPFAEFHVYDSAGELVQAGETDSIGEATFDMPSVADTYTVRVFSRALNSKLKVSVLEDKYNNKPYYVAKTFTLTTALLAGASPYNAGTLTAEALESLSSKIEGGAFNIYYNILAANDYIRAEISQPTWVADKVVAYWKAGFNPYTYYNSDAPLSFYVSGERKLYILGGENGNVSVSDTDHFDDSVILHEYAHFLEDVYGHSDSPGGSHNGNFIIDPRLAWSEGWANYFQAAVLSVNNTLPANPRWRFYVDTYGYASAGGGITIQIDLNKDAVSGPDAPAANEGNFREMSISRTLYKSTRSSAVTVGGGVSGGGVAFSKLWTTFSGNSQSSPAQYSLRNSSAYPTPSPGLFFQLLKVNLGAANTNFETILTQENQRSDTLEYATMVSFKGAACPRNIQGTQEVALPTLPGYFSAPRSNQLKNNDFFLFYHNGSANTVQLAYTPVNSSNGTVMNLDLIVYKASYVYQEDYYYLSGQSSSYIVTQSRRENPSEPSCAFDGSKKCESISFVGQAAGWYMINVKVDAWEVNGQGSNQTKITSSVDGTVTYNLTDTSGTSYLCP